MLYWQSNIGQNVPLIWAHGEHQCFESNIPAHSVAPAVYRCEVKQSGLTNSMTESWYMGSEYSNL